MFDKNLILSILQQIDEALEKIKNRSEQVHSADDFTNSPPGMEKLDGICMLFIAIGEALKKIDKITGSNLFSKYPETDWKKALWVFVILSPIIILI
jgi:uncharacterized protein with HEPN domain